jgi:U32 family peptidase
LKILVPISNIDHYENLIEAGADEFYCGIVPFTWLGEYGMWQPINRREFMDTSNLCTMTAMRILAKKYRKYQIPVKITFNALHYHTTQYELIGDIMRSLIDMGFDTFIIADIGLMNYVSQAGIDCHIHASGEIPVINHKSMKYLSRYPVTRFVFPRKTSIQDMKNCIEANGRDMEYEAFILNENCLHVGAFCNTLHCDEMYSFCFLPSRIARRELKSSKMADVLRFHRMFEGKESGEGNTRSNEYILGNHGCGICYLEQLEQIGITSLKIVGRSKGVEPMLKDVRHIRSLLDALAQNRYQEALNNLKETYYKEQCPHRKMFCYYPQGSGGEAL